MGEKALRNVFKEAEKEFRKEIREAENAWAMTHGALYTCKFTIASIKLTDGAMKLLMNKVSTIGTVLAFKAELVALEKGKKSIDKRTMKAVLDKLGEE
jgi:hypothetical protein